MADASLNAISAQVDLQREIVIQRYMPDTCQLIPSKGTSRTITGVGVIQQTDATAKVWRTLTSIPCRLDMSRAFRPAALKQQTAMVNEFNLELPYDVDIDEDDHVVIDGLKYEIRRLKAKSRWDVTIEALIIITSLNRDV